MEKTKKKHTHTQGQERQTTIFAKFSQQPIWFFFPATDDQELGVDRIKDPVNQQGPKKSEANGKEGRGNFATSEPQVPKPRTKKPGGEEKNEKKIARSKWVGRTWSFLATAAREARKLSFTHQ